MPKRLLVVDDQKNWRDSLGHVFQDMDYKVDAAEGYKDACHFLNKFQYDLVLVDIYLDDLGLAGDGGRLFTLLHDKYWALPVIAITGEPKPIPLQKVRNLFVEYGIVDCIHKADRSSPVKVSS